MSSLILTNRFHNDTATVRPSATGRISAAAMKRAMKSTCGQKDCRCSLTPPKGVLIEQATDKGDYDVRTATFAD
jgi:hypothetical protein